MAKPNEYSVECQTDLFLYELPQAPYIPTKGGIDACTECDDIPYANDTDTDTEYDIELVSILDILVELAMKQAIYEFLHEEELADQQMEINQLMASKRLDMYQGTIQLRKNIQSDHINATMLLENYLSTLLPDILVSLADINQIGLDDEYLKPWLANEIATEIGGIIDSRESLEKLIKDIVETRAVSNTSANKEI